MASRGRDSVYVEAEINGYLDKKSTGVLRNKTRFLASVQGTTLYMEKVLDGVVNTIDLCEAHHVRKVASDPTGAQFEIIMVKKKHVFVCSNGEECTEWIKALQTAMMRKDTINDQEEDFQDIYNTISDGTVSSFKNGVTQPTKSVENPNTFCGSQESVSYSVSSVYSLPYDMKIPEPDTSDRSSGIYSDIDPSGESKIKIVKSKAISGDEAQGQKPEVIHSNSQSPESSKATHCSDVVSEQGNLYDDARSVLNAIDVYQQKNSKHSDELNPRENEVKVDGADGMNIATADVVNTSHSMDSPTSQYFGGMEDDGEELLKKLEESLTDNTPYFQEFTHPLTVEDQMPLDELKSFLSNNQNICKVSLALSSSDDPIAALKKYLDDLNVKAAVYNELDLLDRHHIIAKKLKVKVVCEDVSVSGLSPRYYPS